MRIGCQFVMRPCAEMVFFFCQRSRVHERGKLCPTYKELGGFFIKKKKTPELELRIQIMMIR